MCVCTVGQDFVHFSRRKGPYPKERTFDNRFFSSRYALRPTSAPDSRARARGSNSILKARGCGAVASVGELVTEYLGLAAVAACTAAEANRDRAAKTAPADGRRGDASPPRRRPNRCYTPDPRWQAGPQSPTASAAVVRRDGGRDHARGRGRGLGGGRDDGGRGGSGSGSSALVPPLTPLRGGNARGGRGLSHSQSTGEVRRSRFCGLIRRAPLLSPRSHFEVTCIRPGIVRLHKQVLDDLSRPAEEGADLDGDGIPDSVQDAEQAAAAEVEYNAAEAETQAAGRSGKRGSINQVAISGQTKFTRGKPTYMRYKDMTPLEKWRPQQSNPKFVPRLGVMTSKGPRKILMVI